MSSRRRVRLPLTSVPPVPARLHWKATPQTWMHVHARLPSSMRKRKSNLVSLPLRAPLLRPMKRRMGPAGPSRAPKRDRPLVFHHPAAVTLRRSHRAQQAPRTIYRSNSPLASSHCIFVVCCAGFARALEAIVLYSLFRSFSFSAITSTTGDPEPWSWVLAIIDRASQGR